MIRASPIRFPQALNKASLRRFSSQKTPLKSSFGGLFSVIGCGILTYYVFNAKSSVHEYVFAPLIRNVMDAEESHNFVIKLMSYGLFPRLYRDIEDPEGLLKTDIFNGRLTLKTPIGMAAGFDKNAEAIDSIFNLGFSYVEVGSITPLPQPGNPLPRFFRIPRDEAVINRYGFNSDGHFLVLSGLRLRIEKFLAKNMTSESTNNSFREGKFLAVNLGKNKTGDEINDYRLGVSRFAPFADVLVINISSPNTPGLRNLQKVEKLVGLLNAVVEERDTKVDMSENPLNPPGKALPPVVVKIAPDLEENEIKSIAEAVNKLKIDGIIISNTTISRPTIHTSPDAPVLKEAGGLSGKPIKPISLKALKTFVKYNKDPKLTIIGCGGISSGKDALDFARAGADFVQLYTGFAYKGPNIVNKISEEIMDELKKEGKTWQEISEEGRKKA